MSIVAEREKIALLVLVVAMSTLAACSEGGASPATSGPPPIAVEMVTVTPGDIRDVAELVGQLEAEESVLLKPETVGILDTVEFQEGQRVEKAALLFRLRDAEQKARLREAEARQTLAEEEYSRSKALAGRGTMSQAELDRATAEWQAARARVEVARVELQRTEIRAPFDGVLGARLVSPGDRVETSTGLVQIDAIDRLRLLFSVPEIAVPLVRAGMPLEISVAPWPDEHFPGEVYFIAPSLDAANRRLALKAWIGNQEHKLRAGMFATIRAEIAHRQGVLVVPESAVAYDANGPYIWRLTGDETAEHARVTLGVRRDGRIEITEGLRAGDRIVSAGTHKVIPGARLRAADASAAGAEAQPG